MFFGDLTALFAPARIKIVHLHGYAVSVNLPGAEDDHLLFRATVGAKQLKKVFAHGGGSQFDKKLVVEILTGVMAFGQIVFSKQFPGADIFHTGFENFFSGKNAFIDIGLASDDLTGGKITVFLCLNKGIFINRFAEIFVVVGCNFTIFIGSML